MARDIMWKLHRARREFDDAWANARKARSVQLGGKRRVDHEQEQQWLEARALRVAALSAWRDRDVPLSLVIVVLSMATQTLSRFTTAQRREALRVV